ncbi:hypothetical protein Tco_1315913 [Tanacetum coccineum]
MYDITPPDTYSVQAPFGGVTTLSKMSKVTLDQLLSEQVPEKIVNALGGKAPEITSGSESECETREPLPPLPKLIGAEPVSTSNSLISLADLTLNMDELTLNTLVPKMTKPTYDKVSPLHTIKKKTETKSPAVSVPQLKKKADLSAKQLLLTLIDEVKSLKEQIKVPSNNSPSVLQTRSLESSKGKQTTWAAFVNGLKHNLISINQLCDANYKVLFTKTKGTIFNQNDEVVLISPRRRDVYVIDMSSFN